MENEKDTAVVLEARALNYAFLNVVYGAEMTEQARASLAAEAVPRSFGLFFGGEAEAARECRDALDEVEARLEAASKDGVEGMRREYTALFIGAGSLEAPPWESSYTGDPRLLFQEGTLAVRNAYREGGFLPARYPSVADDHIALEFAFMAALSKRARNAYGEGGLEACRRDLELSADFAEAHLLAWLPLFLERVRGARSADFYLHATRLALAYTALDQAVVEGLLAKARA